MLYVMFLVNGTVFNPVMYFLGCILPDGDHRRAPISLLFPFWRMGFKHRGFTHTLYFPVIALVVGWLSWNWWAGVSLFLGVMIHLVMDAATPSGVRWFGLKKATRR
jgi:membrane-bound metal-dependent hydrolase YbcI (DUF457 family)